MRVTIDIHGAGNAAFEGMTTTEVAAWACDEAGRRMRERGQLEGGLMDVNGNTVARFIVEDAEESGS
jgi:hypothetical protein